MTAGWVLALAAILRLAAAVAVLIRLVQQGLAIQVELVETVYSLQSLVFLRTMQVVAVVQPV
jgi:hypothetical protein